MMPYVMSCQSVDQAAYRKGFSTEDHLFTVSMLIQSSREFNLPLWCGLVDFEKAFDTVEHSALWHVLEQQKVPKRYIALLRSLYDGQVASVQTSVRSRTFAMTRGVKQGDPISALLFIAVMQACFDELQHKWRKANVRRKGIKFGYDLDTGSEHLTNLRFADDVILVAQTRSDVKKMLIDLSVVAGKYGLKINFDKTKISTWNYLAGSHVAVDVAGESVAILDETGAERYLGRKLCFESSQEAEFKNRLAAGWAAFHKHKGELCNKFYRRCDRARLFEATVTPTVLYCSGTWALTQSMDKELRIVRRRMLRYVFRVHRRRDEEWVDFAIRSAHTVDTIAAGENMSDWVSMQRRMKWRLAGKLANSQDGRWSRKVLDWRPGNHGLRFPGRPKTRWTDQIESFAGGDWMHLAADTEEWRIYEDVFCQS